MLDNYFSIV